MILELICSKKLSSMRAKDMAALLQIPKGKRKDLVRCWTRWKKKGRSPAVSGGCIAGQRKLSRGGRKAGDTGNLSGSSERVSGTVEAESLEEDLFIPEGKQGEAYHLDQVEVIPEPLKKGRAIRKAVLLGMTGMGGMIRRVRALRPGRDRSAG